MANSPRVTIWQALALRLGREPTHREACDEVRRILKGEPIPNEQQMED